MAALKGLQSVAQLRTFQSAMGRGVTGKWEWHDLVSAEARKALTKDVIKRQSIIFELIKGEMAYVKDLENIEVMYIRPLRAADPPIIEKERLQQFIIDVFHNFAELHAHHRRLVEKFHEIQREQHPVIRSVTEAMLDAALNFRDAYMEYIPNYPIAAYRIDEEMNNNPAFKEFVEDMDLLDEHRSLIHTGKLLRQPETGFEWNGWSELFVLLFDNYCGSQRSVARVSNGFPLGLSTDFAPQRSSWGPYILYAESQQTRLEWKQKLEEALGLRKPLLMEEDSLPSVALKEYGLASDTIHDKLNGTKDVHFFSVGQLRERTLVIYMKKKGYVSISVLSTAHTITTLQLDSVFRVLEPVVDKINERAKAPGGLSGLLGFRPRSRNGSVSTGFKSVTIPQRDDPAWRSLPSVVNRLDPLGCSGPKTTNSSWSTTRLVCTSISMVTQVEGWVRLNGKVRRTRCPSPPLHPAIRPTIIEVRHVETGRLAQIIPGNDIRCIWDGRGLNSNASVTPIVGPSGEAVVQEARVHGVMNATETVIPGVGGMAGRQPRAVAQHIFELIPTIPCTFLAL
ncbi:Dbl domain-containing protein [Salix suchowensis]|nr:Dbl domain-containing protein [Salix suchowensis]